MVANTEEDDDSQEFTINYKQQYRVFKRKLKFLIYENECFQEALRNNQRRMLKVSRDKNFLLDRLLNYEKVDASSSDAEETESSDDEGRVDVKKKRLDLGSMGSMNMLVHSTGSSKSGTPAKKKKSQPSKVKSSSQPQLPTIQPASIDGHMTSEEVEKHLESRQRFSMEIEKAPVTMPTEMFSNDPSLDSESNEICEMENSPNALPEECLNTELMMTD